MYTQAFGLHARQNLFHHRNKRRDVLQKVRHMYAVDAVVGERQTARDVGEHINSGRRNNVNSQPARALDVPATDV